MKPTGFVILSHQKPRHGEPCNGCGFCCQSEACRLSVEFLKSKAAPCIALEWDGVSKYRCGLITRPAHYLSCDEVTNPNLTDLFSRMLGVDRGCDSVGGNHDAPLEVTL